MAITITYGPRPTIAKDPINQIQHEQQTFFASLDNESEYVINTARAKRRQNFPEPALASHIERGFEEGSAQATQLNPANNLIAINALLITIEALVRAP